MGSECVTTTTIMFTPKSLLLLFVCCVNSQTFYHTSDIGGSYTRVSHGTNSGFSAPAPAFTKPVVTTSYNQPAPPPSTTYHQPPAAYQKPAQTYHQPATTYHQPATTYSQPPATYHQPASAHHSAVKNSYGDKCVLDYTDEDVEIGVPTLDSNCSSEKTKNGISITEQYDCKPITRTVCTEY